MIVNNHQPTTYQYTLSYKLILNLSELSSHLPHNSFTRNRLNLDRTPRQAQPNTPQISRISRNSTAIDISTLVGGLTLVNLHSSSYLLSYSMQFPTKLWIAPLRSTEQRSGVVKLHNI